MSIITEGLILRVKEQAAESIAVNGVIEFVNDATLQAICDLAIIGLNAPDDSAAIADVRRATKQLESWSDDHLAAHAVITNKAMREAETPDAFRTASVKAMAVMIATLERLDRKQADG